MSETIRFFKIVDALKKQKELTDYVELATILNTNKAGVSDIKQGRKKLSIGNIRSLKLSYPNINVDYIIMGEGEMFIAPSANIAPVEVQSQNESPVIDKFFSTLEKKDQRIEELLKENVRLEERLKFLETDKTDFGKIAESASTGNTSLRTSQGATSAGAHLKE
ncbi:transcriptional regulator [Parabacteroides goldsteinii]|uniref:transcriptional regulator n=1 Tax=Parabacteroides goldsteinii TaxID=328812 RepID=UPI003AB1EFCC